MNKKIGVLVVVGLFVIGFLIYWYPVQKVMAEKAVEQYMKKQGISENNIDGKGIMKDYKRGGYEINGQLKDDPGLDYRYTWTTEHGVILIVYVGNGSIDTGMKYPPIPE